MKIMYSLARLHPVHNVVLVQCPSYLFDVTGCIALVHVPAGRLTELDFFNLQSHSTHEFINPPRIKTAEWVPQLQNQPDQQPPQRRVANTPSKPRRARPKRPKRRRKNHRPAQDQSTIRLSRPRHCVLRVFLFSLVVLSMLIR